MGASKDVTTTADLIMTVRSPPSRRWQDTDNQYGWFGKELLQSCAITESVAPTGWVYFYRLLGETLPDKYALFPDSAIKQCWWHKSMWPNDQWGVLAKLLSGEVPEPRVCLVGFLRCMISLILLCTSQWHSDPLYTTYSTACQPLDTWVLRPGPLPGSLFFPFCWEATLM